MRLRPERRRSPTGVLLHIILHAPQPEAPIGEGAVRQHPHGLSLVRQDQSRDGAVLARGCAEAVGARRLVVQQRIAVVADEIDEMVLRIEDEHGVDADALCVAKSRARSVRCMMAEG